jgi:hypothetical protein
MSLPVNAQPAPSKEWLFRGSGMLKYELAKIHLNSVFPKGPYQKYTPLFDPKMYQIKQLANNLPVVYVPPYNQPVGK